MVNDLPPLAVRALDDELASHLALWPAHRAVVEADHDPVWAQPGRMLPAVEHLIVGDEKEAIQLGGARTFNIPGRTCNVPGVK